MSIQKAFQTLAAPAEFVVEEKRSRFLAFLFPIADRDSADRHLAELRERFPDARHHCWAYVIGDPEQAQSAGFNDDGEPSGTAGKPMLNVLLQRKVGNVQAVVVRYFGGTKLGAGGLVRAYGAAVSGALDNAEFHTLQPLSTLELLLPFALEERVRNFLHTQGVTALQAQYSDRVRLRLDCESRKLDELTSGLVDLTSGQIIVRQE